MKIEISFDKRYDNTRATKKVASYLKKNLNKEGKVVIKDSKYKSTEYSNIYLLNIETEMPIENAKKYLKTIFDNILKSMKLKVVAENVNADFVEFEEFVVENNFFDNKRRFKESLDNSLFVYFSQLNSGKAFTYIVNFYSKEFHHSLKNKLIGSTILFDGENDTVTFMEEKYPFNDTTNFDELFRIFENRFFLEALDDNDRANLDSDIIERFRKQINSDNKTDSLKGISKFGI